MRNHQRALILRSIPLPLLLLLLTLFTAKFAWLAEAGKGRIVHIPDELDDVVDDEEDEEWRNWGKKKEKQPDDDDDDDEPPPDFDNMDPAQIQDELMKRNTGPVFGFVKLRLGVKRTKDTVTEIARKWTKVLKTGGTDLNFMGVDLSTIMFTLQGGQDADEVKEFLLGQPDAYEVKIGDRVFQRPGDPSVEEILEKQYREKVEAENQKKEEL